MMSQQSSQQSRANEPLNQSQGSGTNQLREEPQLSVNSSAASSQKPNNVRRQQIHAAVQSRRNNNMGGPNHKTNQLLQQQSNVQGGSADTPNYPNDEMSSAVEQIRQRHQKDMQREQLLQAQSQQRLHQMQRQQQSSSQQAQYDLVALVKEVTEADNTTEFLLLTLQRCFNLKPQQVQQLLQNQNQLLIQANEQGLPVGDFGKVTHFFEFLGQDAIFKKMINQFVKALSANQEVDVILVLGTIKCGLYSRNETTAKLCLELLFKIVEFLRKGNEEYKKRGKPMPVLFDTVFSDWFTKHVPQPEDSFLHNSVLQSVAECIEMHHSLVKEAANLYLSVFKSESYRLSQLPELLKEAYSDDIFMMYETMSSLLVDLNRLDRDLTKAAAEESNMIQDVLNDATVDHGDFALKLKCTNLLIEIWFLYPTIVSMPSKQHLGVGNLSLKDSFHHVLLQGTQERDKVFRINVFANGFTLLDRLAEKDNSETSAVYSTLISGLLEHYKGKSSDKQIDQVSTEMILRGFKKIFREHDDVPKHVMMDPFLDQLIQNLKQHKPGENLMTTMELEFLTDFISEHGHVLQEDTAMLLLEYFQGVFATRPYLTHAMKLVEHIGLLVQEHKERSLAILRFVEQTVAPQALNQLIAIRREELAHATQNPLSAQNVKKGRSPKKGSKGHKLLLAKDKELASDRRLKRFNVISLIDKLYEVMHGVKHQDNLVDLVRSTMKQYFEAFQSSSTGMMHLMEKWDIEVDSFRNRQSLVPALYAASESDEAAKRMVALVQDNQEELSQRIAQKNKKKELEWSKVKDPSNPIALRAVEEFQALKQKRIEKQNKDRLEEAKKKQKEERLKSQAKLEVAKRGMILERDSILRQQKLKAIFSGGQDTSLPLEKDIETLPHSRSVLAQQLGPSRSASLAQLNSSSQDGRQETALALISNKPSTSVNTTGTTRKKNVLVDFDGAEEDREKDSVRLILQKYTTLFRFLFDKYTAKSDLYKKKQSSTRNRTLSEKVISIADLIKLYREHNMDHSMLTKHEFQQLMTQINAKLLKPYEDDALNFAGFVQFFWQSAIYCHNQVRFKAPHETGGKPISSLLFGEMINNLITWFKVAAQARGHQTVLYDYPELAREPTRAQQLAQLNLKLKQNPNMDLPTGFVLSKEMQQVKEYGIPASARKTIGEAKATALEILDELLAKNLEIRLFEPQISVRETQVVKMATQHPRGGDSSRSGASSTLNQQEDATKMNMLEQYSLGTPKVSGSSSTKLSLKSELKKGQIRSLAQISTVQTILQNQAFDDSDIYGLGMQSSSEHQSNQSAAQHIKALDIYKTANILRIREANKKRKMGILDDNVQLSRHRANQLAPLSSHGKGNRALTQVRSTSDLAASKRKASRATRLNENLLLQSEISTDLKTATYEYQLSRTDERDMEPIRQTALVLEDMLQVLSGDLPKYPYGPKKVVKPLKTVQETSSRAISLTALKNKNQMLIKQRLQPGEYKSNLAKQRIEEMKRLEEQKAIEHEKSEMARIKRGLRLKRKIAAQNNLQLSSSDEGNGRARSEQAYENKGLGLNNYDSSLEKGELDSSALANVSIVDPRAVQIEKQKKIQQLRAKQLKQAQEERDAKKRKHEEEGLALMAHEQAEKKRAAAMSKQKIEQGIKRRHELMESESSVIQKATDELLLKQKLRAANNSVERQKKQPPVQLGAHSPPRSTSVNLKVKATAQLSLDKQKKQKDKQERQKMEVYIKKERQEVLAFYLRPDVQTVVAEYDRDLGQLYEKIVGARDALDRDTKRMTSEGYVQGFGETADIVPKVLSVRDLGLIFDTIINERVDSNAAAYANQDMYDDQIALAEVGSLSYEEFKKSIVRLSTLCAVQSERVRMSPNEVLDEQDRLLESSGGEAPAEWDQYGNPIKYKTVLTLRKLPRPAIEAMESVGGRVNGSSSKEKQPVKLYDISKLKLEKFHKVLHYVVSRSKGKQPRYVQPGTVVGNAVGRSRPTVAAADPYIQIQQQQQRRDTADDERTANKQLSFGVREEEEEEAEDTMMDGQKIPVRDGVDDLDDDDDQEEMARRAAKAGVSLGSSGLTAVVEQQEGGYDLTLGEKQLPQMQNNEASLGVNSLQNAAQNSLVKNSLSSHRRQDNTSDGQFSEYNEVLKSPLVNGTITKNQQAAFEGLNSGTVNLLLEPSPRLGESSGINAPTALLEKEIEDDYD